jgi:hypothetical protein
VPRFKRYGVNHRSHKALALNAHPNFAIDAARLMRDSEEDVPQVLPLLLGNKTQIAICVGKSRAELRPELKRFQAAGIRCTSPGGK